MDKTPTPDELADALYAMVEGDLETWRPETSHRMMTVIAHCVRAMRPDWPVGLRQAADDLVASWLGGSQLSQEEFEAASELCLRYLEIKNGDVVSIDDRSDLAVNAMLYLTEPAPNEERFAELGELFVGTISLYGLEKSVLANAADVKDDDDASSASAAGREPADLKRVMVGLAAPLVLPLLQVQDPERRFGLSRAVDDVVSWIETAIAGPQGQSTFVEYRDRLMTAWEAHDEAQDVWLHGEDFVSMASANVLVMGDLLAVEADEGDGAWHELAETYRALDAPVRIAGGRPRLYALVWETCLELEELARDRDVSIHVLWARAAEAAEKMAGEVGIAYEHWR